MNKMEILQEISRLHDTVCEVCPDRFIPRNKSMGVCKACKTFKQFTALGKQLESLSAERRTVRKMKTDDIAALQHMKEAIAAKDKELARLRKEVLKKPAEIDCMAVIEALASGLKGSKAYVVGAAVTGLWNWAQSQDRQDLESAKWHIERLMGGD